MKNFTKDTFLPEGFTFKKEQRVKDDIQVFSVENEEGMITAKSIELAFKKAGFSIIATKDTHQSFMEKFNESNFTLYNMMTFYHKEHLVTLAKEYEEVGALTPMSMSIYTVKGSNTICVATLSIVGMAKIMNIPRDNKVLLELNNLIIYALKLALEDGKFEKRSYDTLEKEGELLTKFSIPVSNQNWKDELNILDFQFTKKVTELGLTIVTKKNLHKDFKEASYEGYDFYKVYSLCKVGVLFNIAKSRPEAGAFAPCNCYVYKKLGEAKIEIAFPSVYNWFSSLAISNAKDIELLTEVQEGMQVFLSEFLQEVQMRKEFFLLQS